MTAIELLKAMGEIGTRFYSHEIESATDYVSKMLQDGRIIDIKRSNYERALLFFSVCDGWEPFYKKKTWDYLPHFKDGKTIYIEKLISTGWNREMRETLETELLKHYPDFREGVWHRYASWGDRKVIGRVKQHV